MKSLGADISPSAHQAIDRVSDTVHPAVSRAASGAHHLVDRLSDVAHGLEKTASRLKDTEQRLVGASSNYVREHPFKSAGIALAAGFLVSQLVSSRKSSGNHHEKEGV